MLILSRPELLAFLLLVPPAVYFRHFWRGRGGRIPFPGFRKTYENIRDKSVSGILSAAASVLFWTSFTAAVVASSGPVRVSREEVYVNRGADIIFVIDESPSMAARDMNGDTRFTAALKLIQDFIRGRKNNYIGLVTFGKEASLQLPPTKDYSSLLDRIEELKPGGLGDETAIGLGLGVACAHLQYSEAPRRIIILLTDGENNAGDVYPRQAARIAAAIDTVVYTCGIGRQGETVVEYEDPDTGKVIRGRFMSRYDEQLLREIAELSGGLFFPAPTEETLTEMFRIIDRVEMEEVETGFVQKEEEKYRAFLIPAVLAFCVSVFLRSIILRESML